MFGSPRRNHRGTPRTRSEEVVPTSIVLESFNDISQLGSTTEVAGRSGPRRRNHRETPPTSCEGVTPTGIVLESLNNSVQLGSTTDIAEILESCRRSRRGRPITRSEGITSTGIVLEPLNDSFHLGDTSEVTEIPGSRRRNHRGTPSTRGEGITPTGVVLSSINDVPHVRNSREDPSLSGIVRESRMRNLEIEEEVIYTGIEIQSLGTTGQAPSLSETTQEDHARNLPAEHQQNNRKRNRKRNIIWFNPPFCKSVETKVGQIFFSLMQKHFPRNHRYHKIFNKNTVKVSYSCMDSMEYIIKQHNMKILQAENREAPRCDCRNPENCPLDGLCNSSNVAYSAVVEHRDRRGRDNSKTYIGISEPAFKKRFTVHEHTFNNRGTPNDTSLSKYIWSLKDAGISDYSIRWSILRRAAGYSKSTKKCGLCLAEKLLICEFPDKESLLNDKSELVSKCRHLNKHLLKSCKEE